MRARTIIPLLLATAALPAQAGEAFPDLVAAWEKAAAKDGSEAAAQALLPEFVAAAERARGKPAAVPPLLWIAQHGGLDPAVGKAVATLVDEHLKDERLGELALQLPFLDTYGVVAAPALLQRIADDNGHPEVQAKALFARGMLAFARPDADAEQLRAARGDLAKAAELTKDKALVARIDALAADDRSLATDAVAPEIAGFDLDGVPFRLSDYRGKVVVLDFWGDW